MRKIWNASPERWFGIAAFTACSVWDSNFKAISLTQLSYVTWLALSGSFPVNSLNFGGLLLFLPSYGAWSSSSSVSTPLCGCGGPPPPPPPPPPPCPDPCPVGVEWPKGLVKPPGGPPPELPGAPPVPPDPPELVVILPELPAGLKSLEAGVVPCGCPAPPGPYPPCPAPVKLLPAACLAKACSTPVRLSWNLCPCGLSCLPLCALPGLVCAPSCLTILGSCGLVINGWICTGGTSYLIVC